VTLANLTSSAKKRFMDLPRQQPRLYRMNANGSSFNS